LQLILDVRTRWDSTYLMIKRFLLMREVYIAFRIRPDQEDFAQKIPALTANDWRKLEAMMVLLSVPHRIQTFLSGSSTPCMADVIPLFELFMEDWENQARVKPQYRAAIKAGLKVAVKHYKRMDDTNAYAIAMCK
ncbi:hypothetical protein FOMPIDRAFT_1099361, partial [Fomitopsis schrenkii]